MTGINFCQISDNLKIGNNRREIFYKEVIILTIIICLALALRLILFFQLKADYPYFSNPPKGTDMFTYHHQAIAHLNGTFNEFPHYYNALYPYFLTFIYSIFGQNILIAKIIQIFLGCITCILIYLISKEIFDKKVGLIAALITAGYAMFIIYNSVLLVATLLIFLIAITLLMLLRIRKKISYVLTAGAGISLGLAVLARGNNIFLIPPIILWLLFSLKGRGKKACLLPSVFFISSIAVISVITIQNYVLSGKFVLLTTNGGMLFAIGNCPGAQGWFHYPDWLKATPERIQTPGDDSAFWFKETIKSIEEEPLRWLKLMLKKFCLFWSYWEVPNNINTYRLKEYSTLLKHFPLFTFKTIAPLALIGIIISFREWRNLSLAYIFLFIYMSSLLFVPIMCRYRLPFVQILIPFSAYAIYHGYLSLRKKDFKSISYMCVLLIPSLILIYAYDIYLAIEKKPF